LKKFWFFIFLDNLRVSAHQLNFVYPPDNGSPLFTFKISRHIFQSQVTKSNLPSFNSVTIFACALKSAAQVFCQQSLSSDPPNKSWWIPLTSREGKHNRSVDRLFLYFWAGPRGRCLLLIFVSKGCRRFAHDRQPRGSRVTCLAFDDVADIRIDIPVRTRSQNPKPKTPIEPHAQTPDPWLLI